MEAVSVVGLGKLGSPMAAVLAAKGYRVVGVDVHAPFVDAINAGRAPVDETDLQAWIDRSEGRLTATTDYGEAVAQSDMTFVIVPTPSTAAGDFSLDHVLQSMTAIGKALRGKPGYHCVVVTSTVMPGATDAIIRPALEAAAGRRVGADLGLCYSPEFIALGSVIRDMLNPDFILIGESDDTAGACLSDVYRRSCDNAPPIARMNFVNAELTKISVNTYVTTKISYANMLADLCDRLPGADVDVVTAAMGNDARIGGKYLKGAVAYGGPCFPRDNRAFSHLARTLGANAALAEATDGLNSYQNARLSAFVSGRIGTDAHVAVLGMSYKPGTGVTEESPGVALVRTLLDDGQRVTVYDPQAMTGARAQLGDRVAYAPSLEAATAAADVVIIATAWPEFGNLAPAQLARDGVRRLVIDCWRLLDRSVFVEVCDIVYLGNGALADDPVIERRSAAQ
jgi:UDPglucose 6-dehydrogenase